MEVNLKNNSGYRWFSNGEVYAKGYIYDDKNELYVGKDLIEYFSSNDISFENRLKHSNGIFAVVIKQHDRLKFAVDRTRTFPLFYTYSKNSFSVFDRNQVSTDSELDEFAVEEFRLSGFVSGRDTLLRNVFQVQAGEYGMVSREGVQRQFYFTYSISAPIENESIKMDLSVVFDNVIQRAINYANDKKLVVPLSAGYDSRLLVALLKKYGYGNVICFTYGRANSYEVKTSKQIANTLGYEWAFVEYTDELINGFSNDKMFKSFFFNSGSNLSSLAHIQDFFAVRELIKRGKVSKDSIFVPGHSGDFLAGSHLHGKWGLNSSKEVLLEAIFKEHYRLGDYRGVYNDLKNKILDNLQQGLAYSVFEDWDFKERQAKFIVNSVRVYEKFDCQYLLPLWDNEMIDFFQYLPLGQKLNTVYYDDFILKGIFKEFQIDLIKPQPSYTATIVRRILPIKLKAIIKGLFSNKIDYNNFAAINEELGEPKGKYVNTVLVDFFLKKIRNAID